MPTNPRASEDASESVVVDRAIHSDALRRDVGFQVYLPSGYGDESRSYPELYLLHGLNGNREWTDPSDGNMKAICDRYYARRPEERRIIVMPEADGLWYFDSADDSCKYETFFFTELMPEVERLYRCRTDRESRAIAGESMGGYGSILYSLHRPDLFSACCALSAALISKEEMEGFYQEGYEAFMGGRPDAADRERFQEVWGENDVHRLIANVAEENKTKVRFVVDCGEFDSLLNDCTSFVREARAVGVPCELRIGEGGHDFGYWRERLSLALEFFARRFER